MDTRKLKLYGLRDIENIPQLKILSEEEIFAIKVVANVLPFRTNNYVVEELIDWTNVPNDPIFQLTFMQKGMLAEDQFEKMANALKSNLPKSEIKLLANEIRLELNPHPSGQMTSNVPMLNGSVVPGVQHKY
ncbi:MAG: lysine 2,3-aminomutase, partial [Ignavibacteriae bacterium]|nr:lysine 2,3-aminomutase [Ignavibacteriota bacterium]